ncbi:hypothetical protein Tco_1077927 [Tanacetum coccineum]
MSLSMEAHIAEYAAAPALPSPSPSPLLPWSPPLPQIPSPPLPPPPSSLHLPPPVPTSLPLPSSPLPPLPVSLFIPPPVDHREDIPEAELPPRKRVDYGFIGTTDAEVRRQRAKEVGYGIKDVWVDPTETVEEVAPTTLEGVNARVTKLTAVQEQDTQDIYAVIEDGGPRFSRGLGIFCWVSSLQGYLSAALGQIQALQARDQTHEDDPEGTGDPLLLATVAARAAATTTAATPMTAAVVE